MGMSPNIENGLSPYQSLLKSIKDRTVVLSHSSFSQFAKSPSHFIKYKLDRDEPTDSMRFGTLVHKLVLEENDFGDDYIVSDVENPKSAQQKAFGEMLLQGADIMDAYLANYKGSTAKDAARAYDTNMAKALETKEGIADWLNLKKEAGKREVITRSTYEHAMRLKESVWRNDAGRFIMESLTEKEKKIKWEFMGFQWVGFIDGEGDGLYMDLKVVADADPRKFRYKIKDMRYHWQSAHYGIGGGIRHKDSYILAVDHSGHVSVTKITKQSREQAEKEIRAMMVRFKECYLNHDWRESYNYHSPDRHGIYEF